MSIRLHRMTETSAKMNIEGGCALQVQVLGNSLVVTTDKQWNGQALQDGLKRQLMLPSAYVKGLFADGRVRSGKQRLSADDVVQGSTKILLMGDVEDDYGIHISASHMDANRASVPLWEDDHALILNKPAGLIIYPSDAGESDTLAHRVASYYERTGQRHKVRHVHRLDRDTTGAILYAKHGYIARALDALLAERRVERTYWAVVQGQPKSPRGSIRLPIGRDRHTAGRYRVSKTGKEAVTVYEVLGSVSIANGKVSLVQCRLETGRTHQIRVHMSAIGCPVVGDVLYGGGDGVGTVDLEQGYALHAVQLAFYHPYDRRQVTVHAPLPEHFAQLLARVGLGRFAEVGAI
jgi:23S rRNA pseudouridine1911/1915/1917 synthase